MPALANAEEGRKRNEKVEIQGRNRRNDESVRVHPKLRGSEQKRNQDTREALKQEYEEPRTYLGLQSWVSEMGHRVLLAGHCGHFYHRRFEVKGLPLGLFVIKCCLPFGWRKRGHYSNAGGERMKS